ncbi:MAG: RNase adapter RapZ [Oscillospiraceae bacterium]|jgi:UPF0042 nucleotide-binding protein|nr:RNase adapter RapZ [Oscillospiraceae bacterium]
MMELILVTGMAGAGKSCALNALEDIGYYAVDNLPLPMLHDFITLCLGKGGRYLRAAVVIDIRSCHRYTELTETYSSLKKEMHNEVRFKMLCMEASENVLITRFRTGRRSHPLAARRFEGDVNAAIRYEQTHLEPLRASADLLLDSSLTSTSQLKDQIKNLFMPHITDAMPIQVMSFGFKYGAPLEADLVFDMRCLPNPYYVPELRDHTGQEKCVQDYVMDSDDSREYFKRVTEMLKFLIPLYIHEGRTQLVVGFGCTGGQHRSVTFAELVSDALRDADMQIITHHRDIKKNRSGA